MVRYEYRLCETSNLTLEHGASESVLAMEYNVEDGEPDPPEYSSLTYVFRSEKTAERMLLQEIGDVLSSGGSAWSPKEAAAKIAIEAPGTDYAGYYDGRALEGVDEQEVFLRRGSRVVVVYYTGEQSLMDQLPLLLAQLEP